MCYCTVCLKNDLHDSVDLQRQLEPISTPVGRPTTFMVTRTYLVPAVQYSPAGF